MKIISLFKPSGTLIALADTWAGFAISGALFFSFQGIQFHIELYKLGFLSLGGMLLYTGGQTLSGYFNTDFILSRVKGKPIAKIENTRFIALGLGIAILMLAITLDFMVGKTSGGISLLVSFLTIFYQVYGRNHVILGPLTAGLVRGGFLCLGISLVPHKIAFDFMAIIIPILFFAANTIIRYAVEKKIYRNALQVAGWMYFAVFCFILAIALINHLFLTALPFAILLFYLVFKPVTVAFKEPNSENIKKAIHWCYLAIILVDSAIAASFSGPVPAIMILCLLPVTWLFAKAEWGSPTIAV